MGKKSTSPQVPVPISLRALHEAWRQTRRGKQPSANQLAFDARWLDKLLQLQATLQAGDWQPTRTVSFVVHRPKTREIHAPDFADRIVHHWLVAQLEPLFEPVFIHDSYANRVGKGSHAAVDRLQQFMRSRNGQGWYLQLDIHNCFNTIHRPTLYAMLVHRLELLTQRKRVDAPTAMALRSLCHQLLAHPVAERVANPEQAALLPAHKRLLNAQPGCGIPVGNLTSQFFANVYMNALDQFVKHELKVQHYVRYVDDFVLLGETPEQLRMWQVRVDDFLKHTLRLHTKAHPVLQTLDQGIDFLGYRVFATHRRVRPRVIAHCREALHRWAHWHVQLSWQGSTQWCEIRANSAACQKLQQVLMSYWGHFSHAQSMRLRHKLFTDFPWLRWLFELSPTGQLSATWALEGETFSRQWAVMRERFPEITCCIQRGNRVFVRCEGWLSSLPASRCRHQFMQPMQSAKRAIVVAHQTGWLKHGTRRRECGYWFLPCSCDTFSQCPHPPSLSPKPAICN